MGALMVLRADLPEQRQQDEDRTNQTTLHFTAQPRAEHRAHAGRHHGIEDH
jgi:hypothetical protein